MWDPVPGCQWNVKVDGRKSPETRMKRQEAGKHLSSGKSFISFFFFGWLILRDEHFLPSYIYISGFLHKNWKKDPVIFVTIVGFDHCSWVFLKSIFFANMNFQKAWKAEYGHCTIREMMLCSLLVLKKCIDVFACPKMIESYPLIHLSSHPVHFGWTWKPGFLKVERGLCRLSCDFAAHRGTQESRWDLWGFFAICRCDEHGDKCAIGFLLDLSLNLCRRRAVTFLKISLCHRNPSFDGSLFWLKPQVTWRGELICGRTRAKISKIQGPPMPKKQSDPWASGVMELLEVSDGAPHPSFCTSPKRVLYTFCCRWLKSIQFSSSSFFLRWKNTVKKQCLRWDHMTGNILEKGIYGGYM